MNGLQYTFFSTSLVIEEESNHWQSILEVKIYDRARRTINYHARDKADSFTLVAIAK